MKAYSVRKTSSTNFSDFNVSNYIDTLESIVASQSGDNYMVDFLSLLFPTIELIDSYIPTTYLSLPLVSYKYRLPLSLITYVYTSKLGYIQIQNIPSLVKHLELTANTLGYSLSQIIINILSEVEDNYNNIYRVNKALKVLYDTEEDLFDIRDYSFYDMFTRFAKAVNWNQGYMDIYNFIVSNDNSIVISSLCNRFKFSNKSIESLIRLKNDYDFHLLG